MVKGGVQNELSNSGFHVIEDNLSGTALSSFTFSCWMGLLGVQQAETFPFNSGTISGVYPLSCAHSIPNPELPPALLLQLDP